MRKGKNHIGQDLIFIAVSIVLAIILVKLEVISSLLRGAEEFRIVGSFLSGMFFVSIFTVAPAGAVLFEIAKSQPIIEVAFWGALGSLLGDLLIFRFMKDRLAEDINWVLRHTGRHKYLAIFKRRLFRWFVPFVGAVIVASPMPDEIGLAMMGLSKMRTAVFIPVAFVLDFLGILVICLIAKGIF